MMPLLIATLSITGLFVAGLTAKYVFDLDFCAICAAVSGTWIPLLSLYHAGYYKNQTVIALLLGQSIVGTFYLLKGSVPEQYHVYTLPYILAATVGAYTLLVPGVYPSTAGVVALLWAVGTVLVLYREHSRVETVFREVVACCKDW